MVRKKHQSKRVSAAQRYKIDRKVREHKRKLKKEMKGKTSSKKKDPGIPNLWPFKEKLLKEAEEQKKRAEEEKERQKKLRQDIYNRNRNLTQDQASLLALATSAKQRSSEFDDKKGMEHENPEEVRDNSKKAFYREFKKVVDVSDVILEVLDARDPIGCRSKQVEEMIMSSGTSKKIILILNKIDLVPREVVEKWLKYLRNELPTVAFKASTQNQRSNIGRSKGSANSENQTSECLGADSLVKLLKNYCRNQNLKTTITVGVIGFPNVGKSSLINSLKRSKACNVGATPGVTKVAQQIHLDKNIRLLDCPGIVFASGKNQSDVLLLRNCLKVEQIEDPVGAVQLLLKRCNKEQIMSIYNVPDFSNTNEFLVELARIRGKLKKGGIADIDLVSKSVLGDWNNGKIPYYTSPPKDERMLAASIVSNFSSEFNIEEIEQEQIKALQEIKPENDFKKTVALEGYGSLDVDLNEPEDEMDMDGEEEEENEEEEEEEEEEAPALLQMKKTKKIRGDSKAIITAEDGINHQDNKQLKKIQKKLKKDKKKGKYQDDDDSNEDEDNDNDENEEMDENLEDDNYNFKTDFAPLDDENESVEDESSLEDDE